ncbi:class I tRNA ligase family protein [Streptomyces sp. HNM0574]|uniref:class I tRNA ligase family protein n=1 Tax=Streptomyces sp. HNM0574 TaxID=2714954 RepID=UPI00146DF2C1|nr:class I tRNA ligase family protein [Streptomyces sp. HNM0574]NLU66124.1 class I tRNA ligase family protein [Streptomyces sp. HNM0574]
MTGPVWITATPPATDGELHIGHLAGPYVAADMLSRYLRADGTPVRFTTGTSDHDSSVEVRSLRVGRKPDEVAAGYREAIAADWLSSGVEFDEIVHPGASTAFVGWLRELYARMAAEGLLVPRTRLLPHCASCERWLHGAHVTGNCPHCDAPGSGGMCHECARPNDCGDLLDARCARCGGEARARRCRRLYLPLEPFRERLAEFWDDGAGMPPRLVALCRRLAEDGLPELAVSHPGEWGVPVPVEGFPEQRVDACFEAAALHLYGYAFDRRAEPGHTVHFCGFGHAFCHAVLLPVLMFTRGLKLPQDFVVNEPYVLDARDAEGEPPVWALDLLAEHGSDTLRRHVLRERPTARRTAFSHEELRRTRAELDATWNRWLSRLFAAVREECGGVVPDAEPGGAGWPTLLRRLERAAEDLREAYGPLALDPRRAVAVLDEAVRCAADFADVNAHLHDRDRGRAPTTGGDERPRALAAQLAVAAALTAWARPVMPEGADRLAAALGVTPGGPVTAAALCAPRPGSRLAPPSGPVFGF